MRIRLWLISSTIAGLSACAQFTTSAPERADLEAAATKAGQAYVNCIVNASDRYTQTGEDAALIVEVSKKACAGARGDYTDADTRYLRTRYMRTEPIMEENLKALDSQAATLVKERVLEQRAAAPAAVAPAAAPTAAPAAAVAPAPAMAATAGSKYLDCMRAEGQRYASVNEPAEVIAEVAQSRCSTGLTDPASAAQLERQGRALVMGMVLDRKAGTP